MNVTEIAMRIVCNGPLRPINPDCPHCNLTAQCVEWVRLMWVAAGIDRGD